MGIVKSIREILAKHFYDIKGPPIKESLSSLERTTFISNHKHLHFLNNISNKLTNSYVNNLGNNINNENSIVQNSFISNFEFFS